MRALLKPGSHGGTPAPPEPAATTAPSTLWVPLSTPRTTHDGRPRNPRLVAGVEGHGRFYAGVLGELDGSRRPHTLHHCTIARCAVLMSHMSSCAISVHVLRYLQARHELYVAPDR